ncbi:MAG: DNA-binding protein [Thermoproteota archaeon]
MLEIEEEELEALRQRRMAELQQAIARSQEEERRRQEAEAAKKALSRVTFTPEARQRLANLKLVRPQLAEQLEISLIQLAQQGKVKVPISDEQLKIVLSRIQASKREINIRRL